jgi:hypothetical protein
MRGIPDAAGQHQVRVFFHQDYLLAGSLISCASAFPLLVVLVPRKRAKSLQPAPKDA